jgi:hypothetical protein
MTDYEANRLEHLATHPDRAECIWDAGAECTTAALPPDEYAARVRDLERARPAFGTSVDALGAFVLLGNIRYVNLTPHAVTVYAEDGTRIVEFARQGMPTRLTESTQNVVDLGGFALTRVQIGAAENLPPMIAGVRYIVSMPLLMGLAAAGIDRPDCLYPFGQVRDDEGRIIGCRSLAYIATRCDAYGCVGCNCGGTMHGQCSCHCPCPCNCGCGCPEAAT